MMRSGTPPQDIVIIGATGSLARLKLFPALYDLAAEGLLPERGQILGLARSEVSQESFRRFVMEAVENGARHPFEQETWDDIAARLSFLRLTETGFAELRSRLQERGRLVYLAIPPSAFGPTVRALATEALAQGTRLLIEKPFGRDLESARELDMQLHEVLDETQIFRIDHYLGKETVQNILVFRFGNSVFERVWNRDAVSHIEITVAESAGIEARGEFYEEVGALRDVFQNHMLQILSMLTMEPPASFEAESIRNEKAKLLRAVRPLNPATAIRGQYTRGVVEGREVRGYLEEANVSPDSQTETFIAARVQVENWRWAGVPIYLRTGKHLAGKATEIEIAFRDVPTCYFEKTDIGEMQANTLTLGIQPREEINFSFLAKVPGTLLKAKPVTMSFSYEEAFSDEPAEAYQRLLHDALMGDSTLFVRSDSVERAWEIVQPVLDNPPSLQSYAAGTWGPPAADDLVAPRRWHLH
jgi:glucose-6-phosphate 1-dehydrogenase